MLKGALVGCSLALLLSACQKKTENPNSPPVTESAPSPKDTSVVLKPTSEQIAKAHRVGNKHCPTDGEKLGAMGSPIPVLYKGELVELCCPSCPAEFAKDPAKYLLIAKADTASN